MLSFTPITTALMSLELGGAEIITFFAPAVMCFPAVALSKKKPVDSITTSISKSFQGKLAGSFSAYTLTFLPFTIIALSSALISALMMPCTESYFNKCASVLLSVRSLMATISMRSSFNMIRNVTLPIRPKPFMATFIFFIVQLFLQR